MARPTSLFVLVVIWSKICWSSQESTRLQAQSQLLTKLLENYDYRIRPNGINGTDNPVEIKVNWMLLRVLGISDYDMDFEAQIRLRLEWVDERLRFEDKGNIRYLTLTDTSRVWVPDLFFTNEKDGHLHKVTSPNNFYRIYPSGHVLYSARLSLTLWCDMQLEKFPFDHQHCSIKVTSYAYSASDLILFWKKESLVLLSKAVGVVGFTMGDIETSYCSVTNLSEEFGCLIVKLHFKRNLGYYILHTFIPSSVLVVVSWASFWIDRRAIVARYLLVLSSLFAMSSVSTDIESSMPNVPYIKAMDLWLAACFTFLLSALVEFAVISAMGLTGQRLSAEPTKEEGSTQKEQPTLDSVTSDKSTLKTTSVPFHQVWLQRLPQDPRQIDLAARVLFPAAFLAFILLYICVYYLLDSS